MVLKCICFTVSAFGVSISKYDIIYDLKNAIEKEFPSRWHTWFDHEIKDGDNDKTIKKNSTKQMFLIIWCAWINILYGNRQKHNRKLICTIYELIKFAGDNDPN